MTENQDLFRLSAEAFEEQQLLKTEGDRIEVVNNQLFETNGAEELLDAKLQEIKDSGVRIWGVWTYVDTLKIILKKAKAIGLTGPGYQILVGGGIGNSLLTSSQSPDGEGGTRDTDKELIEASQVRSKSQKSK